VTWNFQKYLVDRQGNVAAKFNPEMDPDDPRIVAKIEELIG
jgi:glutathione peroxidase